MHEALSMRGWLLLVVLLVGTGFAARGMAQRRPPAGAASGRSRPTPTPAPRPPARPAPSLTPAEQAGLRTTVEAFHAAWQKEDLSAVKALVTADFAGAAEYWKRISD